MPYFSGMSKVSSIIVFLDKMLTHHMVSSLSVRDDSSDGRYILKVQYGK